MDRYLPIRKLEKNEELSDSLRKSEYPYMYPRINTTHVSLYMALLHYWKEHAFVRPLQVFSNDIMPIATILCSTTYNKRLKDLNEFGYNKYEPSYKRNQSGKVYIHAPKQGMSPRLNLVKD